MSIFSITKACSIKYTIPLTCNHWKGWKGSLKKIWGEKKKRIKEKKIAKSDEDKGQQLETIWVMTRQD